MAPWEPMQVAGQLPVVVDFAKIWHASDKVVFSRALKTAPSARTRVAGDFDPEAVRQMKAAAGRDLSVGGPELAAQALKAGLVDEVHLFLTPVVAGGGTASFPGGLRLEGRAGWRAPFQRWRGIPALSHGRHPREHPRVRRPYRLRGPSRSGQNWNSSAKMTRNGNVTARRAEASQISKT